MTTEPAPRIKITYATLRDDNEDLHSQFEAGATAARALLGGYHRNYVDGRVARRRRHVRGPLADRHGHPGRHVRDGHAAPTSTTPSQAARAAQPAWAALGWEGRLAILKRAADLISERLMEYSALMAIEVGKNRIEALGEVEEAADLIRYYAQTAEDNQFYDHPMGNLGDTAVHTRSILRPHGVFAVVSPFNFPSALATGPTGAALHGRQHGRAQAGLGVAAVGGQAHRGARRRRASRPASSTSSWARATRSARRSRITRASTASSSPARTRSGWHLFHSFSRPWPRPCIVEMGGKNPAIVSRHADLDEAAEGIMRSAFGFGGQKCSANSRVYVERPVHDELVRLLVEKTEAITIGDPLIRENWLGPIIDQKAVDRHQTAVSEARRDGTVFVGGERLGDEGLDRGYFVEPTVVGLPAVAPPVPRRAVRAVHRGRRGRLDRRGDHPRQRLGLRPDGRRLQRGSGRGPDASSTASRPA